MATYAGWSYEYDPEGRLASACHAASCAGSGFDRVDVAYDGEGRRTKIVATTSGGVVTTTDLRYAGETVVQEITNGTVTREYVRDEAGTVVRFCDPDCMVPTASYLVGWNGHGDALNVSRINADGSLTAANSYRYDTWGRPTTSTHNGIADLGFRYLWVGAADAQWDNQLAACLLYMHARSYHPSLGRFLQPDPARADASLYGYAGNSPVTKADPSGTIVLCLVPIVGWLACEEVARWVAIAGGAALIWIGTHPVRFPCLWACTSAPVAQPRPSFLGPDGPIASARRAFLRDWNLAQREMKKLTGLKRAWEDPQERRVGQPGGPAHNHWERNQRGIRREAEEVLRRHSGWRKTLRQDPGWRRFLDEK